MGNDKMAALFVSDVWSLDNDAMLAAFNMDSCIMNATIDAISAQFTREIHLMNVTDAEYREMVRDARRMGPRWKGRTRDLKGQLCKTRYEANVMWAWSHRIHDWTVVLPWSFGNMLTPLVAKVNAVACQDLNNKRRLDTHLQELERDYASSANERAQLRRLTTRVHRQHLTGRRNHFVSVPKTVH